MSFDASSQAHKCQCGLPGVRLRPEATGKPSGPAYYKCIPCDRVLGLCPCTTPGSRTTLTCDCSDDASDAGSDAGSPGLEASNAISFMPGRKNSLNPHNPNPGFDEDWESNCSKGYMVSRFKATGSELPPFANIHF